MTKIEAIKEKLRKILAIVHSNGNEHERNMAMLRLQELLVKHRLEMSDIEEKAKEDIIRVIVTGLNGPWARTVASAISKLYFCNYYFVSNGTSDQRFCKHVFVGRPHEAEVAKELAMLVIGQLQTESAMQARRNGNSSFQRSFLNAASSAIYWRVEAMIKESSTPNQERTMSTALMVQSAYEQALAENKQFLDNIGMVITFPKWRTRTKSYEGSAQGRNFGNKVPLRPTEKLA